MDKYKFGEFIYQKRKELGLTQDELGQKLGVTNKAISKWETGENLPDITLMINLASVLGVSVDELLTQKEYEKENKQNIFLNKILFILVILLIILEIATIIVSVSMYNKKMRISQKIDLSRDNLTKIITITPIDSFLCEEQKITIKSNYIVNNNYKLASENLFLKLNFTINYFYYFEDGSIGLMTYNNREVEVIFSINDEQKNTEIILEPVYTINEFQNVKNIEISYEILDCNGTVYCN